LEGKVPGQKVVTARLIDAELAGYHAFQADRDRDPARITSPATRAAWLKGWDTGRGRTCCICRKDLPPRDGGNTLLPGDGEPVFCAACAEDAPMPLECVDRLPCGCYLGTLVYVVRGMPVGCSEHGPPAEEEAA
jgi:ribosome modulation factor